MQIFRLESVFLSSMRSGRVSQEHTRPLSIDGGIEAEPPVLLDRCSHGSVGKSQITSGAPRELYWC